MSLSEGIDGTTRCFFHVLSALPFRGERQDLGPVHSACSFRRHLWRWSSWRTDPLRLWHSWPAVGRQPHGVHRLPTRCRLVCPNVRPARPAALPAANALRRAERPVRSSERHAVPAAATPSSAQGLVALTRLESKIEDLLVYRSRCRWCPLRLWALDSVSDLSSDAISGIERCLHMER